MEADGPSRLLLPVLVVALCSICCVSSGSWQEPDRTVFVGQEVQLPCFPDAVKPTAPLINVHWQKQESLTTVLIWQEGQTPRDGSGFEGRLTLYPRATLVIADLRRSDSGQYECNAWDAHGRPHPNTTIVNLIVSGEIPRFIQEPESVVVIPGKDVELRCGTHPPANEIRWFQHEEQISFTGNPLRFQVSKDLQQRGMYRCLAVWTGGVILASSWANVGIAELNSFGTHKDVQLTAIVGGMAVIPGYMPYGTPEPVPLVEHNGKVLQLAYSGRHMLLRSGNLHLSNIVQEDAGYYRFIATNPVSGERVVATYQVILKVVVSSVSKTPKLVVTPKDAVVIMGSNVTLECVADGFPTPAISWSKDGGELPTGRFAIHIGNLVLSRALSTDSGKYVCKADNGNGHPVSASVRIIVIERPRFVSWVTEYEVHTKEEVVLNCQTADATNASATWLHNGIEIPSENENVTRQDNHLVIHHAAQHHVGFYQCFLTNSAGSSHAVTRLRVIPLGTALSAPNLPANVWGNWSLVEDDERKDRKRLHRKGKRKKFRGDPLHDGDSMVPPTRPEVTRLSDHSVMVRWSVPPNKGYAIRFFKVQYKDVGRSNTRWRTIDDDILPHIQSYEVSDLRTGHTYRFRISAVYANNDNNHGPNSAKFTLQKSASSGRKILAGPIIVHAEAISPSAINISWHYVDMISLPIKGFFVHYRATTTAGDFIKVSVNDPFSRDHIISHLLPDTFYEMKMQSFNGAGASSFSNTYKEKTKSSKSLEDFDESAKPEVDFPSVSDTEASSRLLYIILGTVFGILVISLIAFVVYCTQKQRRTRREAAANRTTYSEVNSVQYDSKGASFTGNGRNSRMPNGSVPAAQPMLLLREFTNGSSTACHLPVQIDVEAENVLCMNPAEGHSRDEGKLSDIEAEVRNPLLQRAECCQGDRDAVDIEEDPPSPAIIENDPPDTDEPRLNQPSK